MSDYAIELLETELKELESNIAWVEDPKSIRFYKNDDEEDLKRWNKQIKDIESALVKLRA